MLRYTKTHTGKIYVDDDKGLEFLSVGDYGKANNIKASFLGLNKEINGVTHQEVDLHNKWVATISTQHGCMMHCKFCDCPKYHDKNGVRNISLEDLVYEVTAILVNEPKIESTERFNLHFARMGEPTFNPAVLTFAKYHLRPLVKSFINAKTIHPVVSTMMPVGNKDLETYLQAWCDIKNNSYDGEAGLQLSIQSTDDKQRDFQFNRKSLPLDTISGIARDLPIPRGRKYTLNFAVTKDTILDAKVLRKLFDPEKFIVKITPIHQTKTALDNSFDVTTSYDNYNVYRQFEDPLVAEGFDVIVFVPSKEEDSDRITCGNALLALQQQQLDGEIKFVPTDTATMLDTVEGAMNFPKRNTGVMTDFGLFDNNSCERRSEKVSPEEIREIFSNYGYTLNGFGRLNSKG